ncbi:MAG: transcription termination factor NusA [Archangium sp.]|nr:transcription termination factor NusA [Archangium sp.]MDP3157606.1 transcription termination factor NusA [Archangium sp.]MDP3572006.1 transcription termination factor NusA [Archangium sp.]
MTPATAALRLDDVLTQVAKDKGIDKTILISTLEDAMKTAAKKHFGQDRALEAKFEAGKGVVEIFQAITVVDVVTDPLNAINNITVAQAAGQGMEVQPGDELVFQIFYRDEDALEAKAQDEQYGDILGLKTFRRGFGRIAAQTAKQVLLQRTRDVERENVFNEYKDRKGEIVTGIARRLERGNLIVDLGRAESVLPVREQVPREVYRPGDRVQAFVLDVLREAKGPQIILSRASVNLLTKLFEMEVPEIAEGIVVIEAAAREPGRRSKIAVSSRDADVDPVGACVGIKGSRVQAVVQELRGEKIDIVEFDEDPARFVCAALAPAEVSRVIIDEANHAMEIIVPDDQLSLAIGRSGQNVRLAAQLTGWKLDINSESRVKEMREFADRSLGSLPGINEILVETLYAHGFRMAKDIAEANAEVLAQIPGLDAAKVAPMQETARKQMVNDAIELEKMQKDREQRRLEEERRHPDELSQEERLARVRGIGTTNVDSFKLAGFGTVEEIVKEMDLTRIGNVAGIGIKKARQIKAAAEHYMNEENKRRAELDALKKAQTPAVVPAPAAPAAP